MKFPAGLVTVHLNVEHGTIKSIRFYGDFFGNGDLEELEQAMAGLPLDDQLNETLKKMDIAYYMSGITAEDLTHLLRG